MKSIRSNSVVLRGVFIITLLAVTFSSGYFADKLRVKYWPATGDVHWQVFEKQNGEGTLQLSLNGKNLCWMGLDTETREKMIKALTFK